MKKIFFILISILFISADCSRKEDCHMKLKIQNNSNTKIVFSTTLRTSNWLECQLIKIAEINPNDYFEYMKRGCWEEYLKSYQFHFYIVDKNNFNNVGFYGCDSIEYYNTVLKEIELSSNDIETLKANNWTITYP